MTDNRMMQSGQHILIPIFGEAEAVGSAGELRTPVKGELILEPIGDPERPQAMRVARFGLAAGGLKANCGPTGTITVVGDAGLGTCRVGDGVLDIEIEIPGRINYPSLDRARGASIDKGCAYRPEFEPCSTRVSLRVNLARGKADGRVSVYCAAGDFGEVIRLGLVLKAVDARSIRPPQGEPHFDGNTPYDPCIGANRRSIAIRPVGFRSNAADLNPTGVSIAAQLAMAQTVWNKACIDFNVLPTIIITDATLKTSSNLAAIRAARDDLNEIEIFFVDNALASTGGGNSGAIGVASCQIVVADSNAGNTVLVAHELGHVLGLQHPPGTSSDPNTVMQPTGSANVQGAAAVIFPMMAFIANPLLITTATPGCLMPDKGDHYIKDFPVDIGLEPSDPLPAGMTRYSMSNVWNRQSNTTGGWSATTGPDHEPPFRFNADGVTPATNHFFARVEQRNIFPVGAATVKFYLKTPGSGGGALNLNLVASGPVPAGLALGTPRDVHATWSVPAGAPSHSCCFAVVSSPEEPEGTPAVLSWAQFEDMCHQDNDWAQRNLDIIDIGTGNTGSGNVYEAAPWSVQLPQSTQERLPLVLNVVALGEGLRAVEIELPGVMTTRVKPGEATAIKVKTPLAPGDECPVIIRATLAGPMRPGSRVSILVDPVLGKQRLIGFGTSFRNAGTRAALRLLLDRALAAAVDIADVTDEEAWHQLAYDVRGLLREGSPHFPALARRGSGLASLMACVESSARWPRAERYGLPVAGRRLIEVAANGGDFGGALGAYLSRAHMAMPNAMPMS